MSPVHRLHLSRAGLSVNPVWTASGPMALRDAAPDTTWGTPIGRVPPELDEEIGDLPTDRDFFAIRAAYRATGGTARGDEVARLLEDHRRGEFVSLGRLILSGDVFGFEWRHTFWVPMFQFDLRDLSIRRGPRQVLAELATAFDGWTLAVWFAHPNCWLNDRRPVDLLDSSLPAVLEAARTDRYIAAG